MARHWGGLTKDERSEVVRMERGIMTMDEDRYAYLRAKAKGETNEVEVGSDKGLACPYCPGRRGHFNEDGDYHCPDCGFVAEISIKEVIRYG